MGLLDNLKNALGSRKKDAGDSPQPQAPDRGPAEIPTEATHYTVQSGDTLYRIARDHYGDGEQYLRIFEANRELLGSPDRVEPGQVLAIPPRQD